MSIFIRSLEAIYKKTGPIPLPILGKITLAVSLLYLHVLSIRHITTTWQLTIYCLS